MGPRPFDGEVEGWMPILLGASILVCSGTLRCQCIPGGSTLAVEIVLSRSMARQELVLRLGQDRRLWRRAIDFLG